MQVKHHKSLLWLSRWHNGQSQRIWRLLDCHMLVVQQLIQEELVGRSVRGPIELTICGIHILCELREGTLILYSISPPDDSTGVQRSLFTLSQRPRQRERLIHFPARKRRAA